MTTPGSDYLVNNLSNLRRLWRLWETSGTAADDVTENQDGAHIGATPGSAALSGDAGAASASYDGVDDYTRQATEGLFNASASQPIAIGMVYRSASVPTGAGSNTPLIAFSRLTSSRRALGIYTDTNGQLAAFAHFLGAGNAVLIEPGSGDAGDDAIHTLIAVVNGATDFRLYVDGSLAGSNATNHGTGTSGSDYDFTVGTLLSGGANEFPDGLSAGLGPDNTPEMLAELAWLANNDIDATFASEWDAAVRGSGGADVTLDAAAIAEPSRAAAVCGVVASADTAPAADPAASATETDVAIDTRAAARATRARSAATAQTVISATGTMRAATAKALALADVAIAAIADARAAPSRATAIVSVAVTADRIIAVAAQAGPAAVAGDMQVQIDAAARAIADHAATATDADVLIDAITRAVAGIADVAAPVAVAIDSTASARADSAEVFAFMSEGTDGRLLCMNIKSRPAHTLSAAAVPALNCKAKSEVC